MSRMNLIYTLLLVGICITGCRSDRSPNKVIPDISDQPNNGMLSSPEVLTPPSNKGRLAWQKPQEVIQKLGDLSGKTVADIGAGTGYFTFRFVNQAQKVIAIDIDQDMLDLISSFKENLTPEEQAKLEIRLATPTDAKLWPEEVDVIVIINTIGYIQDPKLYLQQLMKGLKPKGMLMIVDFKIKRIPEDIAPPVAYRIGILELEDMLAAAGYTLKETDDTSLDYQYMIVAHKGD